MRFTVVNKSTIQKYNKLKKTKSWLLKDTCSMSNKTEEL